MYFFTVVLRKGLWPHIDNDPKLLTVPALTQRFGLLEMWKL